MACSACILTAGITNNCNVRPSGGNSRTLYLANHCEVDLDAIVKYNDDLVSSLPLLPGGNWYKVVCKKESVVINEPLDTGSDSVSGGITFQIGALSANTDKEIARAEQLRFFRELSLGDGQYVLVAEMSGGVWHVMGIDGGLETTAADNTTGTARTDFNGATITMQAFGDTLKVIDGAYVRTDIEAVAI